MPVTHRRQAALEIYGDSESAVRAIDQTSNAFSRLDAIVAVAAGNIAANVTGKIARAFHQGIAQAKGYIAQSTVLAARLDSLNIALQTQAANAGYTISQMSQYENALKETGITTEAARGSLLRMIRANIDLAHSSKLARLAQDAAIAANRDSSETFNRLIYAIQTGNNLLIDELGLRMEKEQALKREASALGKTVEALTKQERAQALVNDLLQQGEKLAGTYEMAMTSAGKQMTSMTRHSLNLQEAIGNIFQPAFAQKIQLQTTLLKTLYKFVESNQEIFTRFGKGFGF